MYNPLTKVSTRMLVRTFIVASNYNIFDLIWTNTRKAENIANITLCLYRFVFHMVGRLRKLLPAKVRLVAIVFFWPVLKWTNEIIVLHVKSTSRIFT